MLFAASYTGVNGVISMNAFLGLAASPGTPPADLLNVSGSATGTTKIKINDTSGVGAQTSGDGILLIQTGTPASPDAFVLEPSTIPVNGWVYALYQGDASGNHKENWYLRSKAGGVFSTVAGIVAIPLLGPAALLLLIAAAAALAAWQRRRGRP
jgi:outer membrane autotransporter protein